MESAKSELSRELEQQKSAINEKEIATGKLQEHISSLETQISEQTAKNKELEVTLQSQNSRNEELTAEHSRLKAVFEETNKMKSATESELQSSLTKLTADLENVTLEKAANERKILELNQNLDDKTKSLESTHLKEQTLLEELGNLK